jgi:hypothetical protein
MKTFTNYAAGAVLAALSLSGLGPAAEAQGRRINALVMTENASEETMSRLVPVYRRVLTQLQENLNTRGIQVYDETASTMRFMAPGQARRSDAEVLSVARAVMREQPVDVVVLFEIVAAVTRDPFQPQIQYPQVRMPARVLDLRGNNLVAAFEVNMPRLPALPLQCDATCLFNAVGDDAKLVASELSSAIADKLAAYTGGGMGAPGGAVSAPIAPRTADNTPAPPAGTAPAAPRCDALPGDTTIRFKDFTSDEILEMERNLRMFSCFVDIRPIQTGATFGFFSYRSSAGTSRLDRNLRVMLDYLNLRGQVRFDGREFEVVKVQTR